MGQKDGIWSCDVCDESIPLGTKRYPLDGGRFCCARCWEELKDAKPKPAPDQIASQVVMVGTGVTVAPASAKTSGMAVASLVLGILSLVTCFLGVVPGILAIVLGAVSLSSISKNQQLAGRGMAVAGLIMGVVGTILGFILLCSFLSYSAKHPYG